MKVPYALTAAVAIEQRNAQMLQSVTIANERGYGRLEQLPIDDTKSICIACYGPSLAETWQDLTHPILSMSGATRFLADRGVIADYHIDMDPRPHKVKHLIPPVPGVHYLMASVCPPETWEILKDHDRVSLWHTYSGKNEQGIDTYGWVYLHDKYQGKEQLVIHGGSTIGLTGMHIAGVLGYRHLEIHGMDGNRREGGVRHAGIHYGKAQKDPITWAAEGRKYETSQIMSNAVAETINTAKRFPMFCVFHGDGLTQALIREENLPNACTANQTEKADRVRRARARIVELPTAVSKTAGSYWDAMVDVLPKNALPELIQFSRQAEQLRHLAKYNTGTIPLESALLLRALCHYHQPKIVVEVGTFIGTSTYALTASEALFTCDRDNDCIVPTDNVHPHPFKTSTEMLQQMVDDGHAGDVDLFFFDGRIQDADVPLIQHLSHPKTVYVFDDAVKDQKGEINLKILRPLLPDHGVIPPNPALHGRSTLAALIPFVERVAA